MANVMYVLLVELTLGHINVKQADMRRCLLFDEIRTKSSAVAKRLCDCCVNQFRPKYNWKKMHQTLYC